MPELTNSNGVQENMAAQGMGHMEGRTGDTFLFTSESVGEGHPGKQCLANGKVPKENIEQVVLCRYHNI